MLRLLINIASMRRFLMSTHDIQFHDKVSKKCSLIFIFFSYRKKFVATQNQVRIIQGKRVIGVRVIAVLLYLDIHVMHKQTSYTECSQSFFLFITKTYLYNFNSLIHHFNIVKLRFTGVYNIFLISAQKHRLWVLVRTASATIYFLSRNMKNIRMLF